MLRSLDKKMPRRGTIVPLFALLLPLMGMLAFAIDVGYIALIRTDL